MSALIGHAKAARILAEEFSAEEEDAFKEHDETNALLFACLACVYGRAADRMEQAMREEATDLPAKHEDGK